MIKFTKMFLASVLMVGMVAPVSAAQQNVGIYGCAIGEGAIIPDSSCATPSQATVQTEQQFSMAADKNEGLKVLYWMVATAQGGPYAKIDGSERSDAFTYVNGTVDGMTAFLAIRLDYITYNLQYNADKMPQLGVIYTNNIELATACEPPSGYDFEGWVATNDYDPLFTSVVFAANARVSGADFGLRSCHRDGVTVTLNPKWKPHAYRLGYDLGDGQWSGAVGPALAAYGSAVALPCPVRKGYAFSGWKVISGLLGDEAKWGLNEFAMTERVVIDKVMSPNGDGDVIYVRNLNPVNQAVVNLQACWTAKHYTVTLLPHGAVNETPLRIDVEYDKQPSAISPIPQYENDDSFGGYWTEERGGGVEYWDEKGDWVGEAWTNDMPLILHAYVKENPKRHVFFIAGRNDATCEPLEKDYDKGVSYGTLATAATKNGWYVLEGWYTQAQGGTKVSESDLVEWGTSAPLYLYAHWQPSAYTVAFDGNGATNETGMANQEFKFDEVKPLSHNIYARPGYAFSGWATNVENQIKVYADYQFVSNVARRADETVKLYAVWSNNSYRVVFNGNGGLNKDPEHPIQPTNILYDTEFVLPPADTFMRDFHKFVCWSNTVSGVTNAANSVVSNLCDEADGTVTFKAVWESNLGDLSEAMGCENLIWEGALGVDWARSEDEGCDAQGTAGYPPCIKRIGIEMWMVAGLSAEINTNGVLSFWWKKETDNDKVSIALYDAADQLVPFSMQELSGGIGTWNKCELNITNVENSSGSGTLVFTPARIRIFHFNDPSDGSCYIDQMRWIPDSYVLHFDANGGSGAPEDINVELGKGALIPDAEPTHPEKMFLGWTTNAVRPGVEFAAEDVSFRPGDEYYDKTAAKGQTNAFHAVWATPVVVPVPQPEPTPVYDGTAKIGVAGGAGYELSGVSVATNAGDYVAIAKLASATNIWNDGTRNDKRIPWTIAKGTNDLSGITFESREFPYDGKEHALDGISGTLPPGVSVVYSGDPTNRTEIGTNVVTASFTVADVWNWSEITTTLTAKLVIKVMPIPAPQPIGGLVYSGTEQIGVAVGEGYTLEGNVATEAGEYVATATPELGYAWEDGTFAPTDIVWSIAKGTKDVSGISFPSLSCEYDAKPHAIGIVGTLPDGVSVVYSGATTRTAVGTSTVTARFVVADTKNWNEIAQTLTAQLAITERPAASDRGRLYFEDELGAFTATAASTYYGWLHDPVSGNVVATLQVKTTAAKAGKPCKSTITVTPIGGKKKSYKAEFFPGENAVDEYGIVYGTKGLSGAVSGFVDVPNGALVEAAKDFSKAKDPSEKALTDLIPVGCRTLALFTSDGGCDCLSVTISKKGKASVKGTLSDGTTVSLSVQGAVGSDAFAVPVAYSKKVTSKATGTKGVVSFAFVLWIGYDAVGSAKVDAISGGRWVDAVVGEGVLSRPADGPHFVSFVAPTWGNYLATVDGFSVTPSGERITVSGKKWSADKTVGVVKSDGAVAFVKRKEGQSPANLSKLKLSYTDKTGLVKGSFKLYSLVSGKLKTESATVTGIVVNGRFYGNAVIKKKGLTPIRWE